MQNKIKYKNKQLQKELEIDPSIQYFLMQYLIYRRLFFICKNTTEHKFNEFIPIYIFNLK